MKLKRLYPAAGNSVSGYEHRFSVMIVHDPAKIIGHADANRSDELVEGDELTFIRVDIISVFIIINAVQWEKLQLHFPIHKAGESKGIG